MTQYKNLYIKIADYVGLWKSHKLLFFQILKRIGLISKPGQTKLKNLGINNPPMINVWEDLREFVSFC